MRPAIVTNADRAWALAQKPSWFRMGAPDDDEAFGEIVDDGGWLDVECSNAEIDPRPSWSQLVWEEIERFEKHYAGQFKSQGEWSSIWRKGWWPKVSPRKRFPKSAPKEFHPFFRAGSAEFQQALNVAKPAERRLWQQIGIAQFDKADPRLKKIKTSELR